ncbi:MAG: NAD(+) synthase [Prevotellaceae bacterium]|jgi:NAD+ synthase|nr:NAD(+) synthase [Prevotellaceae bacterium]
MKTKSFVIIEQNVADYAGKIGAWIREKVETANRKGVVLGLSGGIDSSVVARLCQQAKVDIHLVLLPYGDDMKKTGSMGHVMEFIEKFRFPYHTFDIKPAVDALTISDPSLFPSAPRADAELSRANLRPRVRMTYLYEVAQLDRRFVIGTGNLAEATVGYFTKWGDGAHDLNPLAMLTKKEVYTLARYLQVPGSIIDKQPSAGLWEGQTDEAELGITYNQIDAYLLEGTSGSAEADRKIEARRALSAHKAESIPVFEG